MATIQLISTITEDYLPTARLWLDSVSVVTSAGVHCVTYKWHAPASLRRDYPFISFVHLPEVSTESHGMIQHGRFLDAFNFPGDTLVCLTDTDILVNRDFNSDELALFNSFGPNMISAAHNGGPDDTLGDEAGRIGYAPATQHDFDKPLYNCGVMVGTVQVFRRIQLEYERDCAAFYGETAHRSRCQFQFWRAWHRMAGPKLFTPLPGATHQHGHFGTPKIINLSRIMFRHKI